MVSSRVRLARNLEGAAFPGWAGEEECERLWRTLSAHAVEACPSLRPRLVCEMDELAAGGPRDPAASAT